MEQRNNIRIDITGDTHRAFNRIEEYCEKTNTSQKDILIILGDAGINYYCDGRDHDLKKKLAQLPITLFSIHGNHEARPETIPGYKLKLWREGLVYVQEEFPNLLFGKDGEIYNFEGKKTLVLGGAYSVDKYIRLRNSWEWFSDEQPSQKIKDYVEQQLNRAGWKVDIILSHTVPLKYEPVEVFLKGIDQTLVDKSTEKWLESIEKRLVSYEKWYAGHYHTEKRIDKIEFMYENIHSFLGYI